jgi:hypothetical protein
VLLRHLQEFATFLAANSDRYSNLKMLTLKGPLPRSVSSKTVLSILKHSNLDTFAFAAVAFSRSDLVSVAGF